MMTAGKYYIGDLCYVMHDKWDAFCSATVLNENECRDGEFVLPCGTRVASYGTAYGDGTYTDNEGFQYGVDAGLLGCIKVADIAPAELENLHLGRVVEIGDFETGAAAGVIHFGAVVIDTNQFDEDEGEYE